MEHWNGTLEWNTGMESWMTQMFDKYHPPLDPKQEESGITLSVH